MLIRKALTNNNVYDGEDGDDDDEEDKKDDNDHDDDEDDRDDKDAKFHVRLVVADSQKTFRPRESPTATRCRLS